MPKYKAAASEIQSMTTIGDEASLAIMAQNLNLGVNADKLDESVKGTIGLAKALGIANESAARYYALAESGETTVLRRYLPALRQAKDKTEEMRIIQEAANRGFAQARAETNTLAGAKQQLANSTGDLKERFGELLSVFGPNVDEIKSIRGEIDLLNDNFGGIIKAARMVKAAFKTMYIFSKGQFEMLVFAIDVHVQNLVRVFTFLKEKSKEIFAGGPERDFPKLINAMEGLKNISKQTANDISKAWEDAFKTDIGEEAVSKAKASYDEDTENFNKAQAGKRTALAGGTFTLTGAFGKMQQSIVDAFNKSEDKKAEDLAKKQLAEQKKTNELLKDGLGNETPLFAQ